MSESIVFPSTEWFQALAKNMKNESTRFQSLGSIDCTMVVKAADRSDQGLIEVRFRSYGVESIRQIADLSEADADHFVIEATLDTWRDMIDNIRANGQPDLEHTLNFLTFPDDPMVVDGPDQLQIDAFFRYNQSLQLFFNGAAQIETQYT